MQPWSSGDLGLPQALRAALQAEGLASLLPTFLEHHFYDVGDVTDDFLRRAEAAAAARRGTGGGGRPAVRPGHCAKLRRLRDRPLCCSCRRVCPTSALGLSLFVFASDSVSEFSNSSKTGQHGNQSPPLPLLCETCAARQQRQEQQPHSAFIQEIGLETPMFVWPLFEPKSANCQNLGSPKWFEGKCSETPRRRKKSQIMKLARLQALRASCAGRLRRHDIAGKPWTQQAQIVLRVRRQLRCWVWLDFWPVVGFGGHHPVRKCRMPVSCALVQGR